MAPRDCREAFTALFLPIWQLVAGIACESAHSSSIRKQPGQARRQLVRATCESRSPRGAMTRFISQDSVAAAATQIVKTAESSVDITGAWITGSALRILLQSIRAKI